MTSKDYKKLGSALLLLLVLVAAYAAFQWNRNAGIQHLQVDSANQLHVLNARIFAPTDKYSFLPNLVADYEPVLDVLRQPKDPRRVLAANRLLEQLNKTAGSGVIYVLDAEGLTIASSNWQETRSFVGQNYAFRPYFTDAVMKGTGRFYAVGVTSMMPGYYISRLVRQGQRILGVVVVKVDIHSLKLDLSDKRYKVIVTDENGIIFLSSEDDWQYRPLWPLAAELQEKVKRTRQYEKVLKEPMPMRLVEDLATPHRIVAISHIDGSKRNQLAGKYFITSSTLPSSSWTVHLLVPMDEIENDALKAAYMAGVALAFIVLLFLYLGLLRKRGLERRKSQAALEQAHWELQQKHHELQEVSEELRLSAITDPLTSAFNRRFLLEATAKMVSFANRHRKPLSIIMIDADHFKQINDEYGHEAGDRVLQMLTAICRQQLREEDIFARFGGEEFVMALPNTGLQEALLVAERVRRLVMETPIAFGGKTIDITVSCGVSVHRPDESRVEGMIRRADEALYRAKRSGRNKVCAIPELAQDCV